MAARGAWATSAVSPLERIVDGAREKGMRMRWHEDEIREFREHLGQIGLNACPVCQSTALEISLAPVLVPWRGFVWSENRDSQTNTLFAVLVTCDFCAYMLLFHAEQIRRGSELRLVRE